MLAGGCGGDDTTQTVALDADAGAALAGTAPAVGGGTVDLGAFAGEDLVVWFWAPW